MYQILFSYPRVADERGAVSDIRAHIAREVMLKTGEPDVRVFQDRTGLRGGDPWSEALEAELRAADLLVPFLCPLWLTSAWCRKEFHLYLEFGVERGVRKPVVPLLWENTKSHHARDPDQLATLQLIETYQAVPWQSLRHQDSGYKGYRAALSAFADAIAEKLLLG